MDGKLTCHRLDEAVVVRKVARLVGLEERAALDDGLKHLAVRLSDANVGNARVFIMGLLSTRTGLRAGTWSRAVAARAPRAPQKASSISSVP